LTEGDPCCGPAIASAAPVSDCDPIHDQAFTLEQMQLALEGSHIGIWDWNLVTGEMHVDRRTRALWGISDDTSASFEHFRNALHPQDRERSNDAIGDALDPTREGDYEFECRVISQADGVERWIAVRGRTFFENGRAIRILGTVRDISGRKHRERHVRILLRELVHRSRSLLAVVQAMSQQTAAGATSLEEVQGKFEARLQALSVAHDLLVSQNWHGASMHDLVQAEMAYCLDTSRRPCGRACANGPQIMLKPKAAQNIGLALHELAMNALAHGALARLDGCVTVIWSVDNERLIVEWRETGGPAVAAPPREGFGHMVVKRIVAQALGAKAIMSFPPNGFMWTLSVPAANALATWQR
jgi:PAS domain S-box-containing protein